MAKSDKKLGLEQRLEAARKEIKVKADQLTLKFGRTVTPFLFVNPKDHNDFIIGFIKDPERLDKMRSFDMYESSRSQAGDIILRTSLIQEESDARILTENVENDAIYMGAIDFAIKLVALALDHFKKK